MTTPLLGRWLPFAAILFLVTPPSRVHAATEPTQASVDAAAESRALAQALAQALAADDYGSALSILEASPDISQTPDGVRLRAALLARLGRTDQAMALLEGWMATNGDDALARFQVGEIHFASGRLTPARLSYRLALAGALDPMRRQIVEDRLAAITSARNLRISVNVAVAPDSNLNSGADTGTIDLFGLPFTLSEDARRQSGMTALLAVGVERRWPVNETIAIQAGGSLSVLDAPNRAFDQTQMNLFVGPELRFGIRRTLSAAATYREIDLGGATVDAARGLRLSATDYPNAQTLLAGTIYVDEIDNRFSDEFDGWSYGGQFSRTRYMGPNALWRASVTITSHDLFGAEADYDLAQVSTGRLVGMPLGVSAYIEPYARLRTFKGVSTAFGVRREDQELGLTVRLSKRDLIVHGAFPYVQAVTSRSWSNVALGDYSRNRLEFGFTRDF